MGTLRLTLLFLVAVGVILLAEGRRHYKKHDDSDEDHHDSDEDHNGGKKVVHNHFYRGTVKNFVNYGGKIKLHRGQRDEDHHSDEDHSDNDKSHDSDEDSHHSDEDSHDSDEDHDSDENQKGDKKVINKHFYYGKVKKFINYGGKIKLNKHHDSKEDHHDSDEDHHDSDESHHDSDEDDHHDSDEDHHDSDEDHDDDEHHVYHFHIGEGFGPYEYIDPNTGYLKGFDVDLLLELCRVANKECYYTLDTDENCWHTSGQHELPGRGLLDGWYDGCMGLAPTPERLDSFNFTLSHAPNIRATLHFREGEIPQKKDLRGKKIGFVSGWAFSRGCLARQNVEGNKLGEYIAIMYEDHEDMVQGLLKKEVDAILTTEASELTKRKIVPAETWFYCATAGPAVMVRKGDHLVDWWNAALEKMVSGGRYRRLCQQARDKHGSQGKIFCLDD